MGSAVLLYLGISEHVGVPLVGINMPGHLALRWNFNDGTYFNWEATVPATCKNSFYISWKNISEVALRNGVYIKAEGLTKKEVIAHVYYNTGLVLKERRQLDSALTVLDKATALFPKYADAYNLKGVIWQVRGETVKAIGQYDTAIGFDPNFSDAYYNRADAKWKIKDPIGTKKDLAVLKTLDLGLAERLEYMIQEI